MLESVKVGEIHFPEIRLKSSSFHKVRGYYSRCYMKYDLIHNHYKNSDQTIYRYPAIQFKQADHLIIYGFKTDAKKKSSISSFNCYNSGFSRFSRFFMANRIQIIYDF